MHVQFLVICPVLYETAANLLSKHTSSIKYHVAHVFVTPHNNITELSNAIDQNLIMFHCFNLFSPLSLFCSSEWLSQAAMCAICCFCHRAFCFDRCADYHVQYWNKRTSWSDWLLIKLRAGYFNSSFLLLGKLSHKTDLAFIDCCWNYGKLA